MASTFRPDATRPEEPGLEERLRTSLRDARGNLEIRRRLVRLALDADRFAALQQALGPRHALLRELRRLLPAAAAVAGQPSGAVPRVGEPSGGVSPTPQLFTPSTQS
jgi:hypothetical protein